MRKFLHLVLCLQMAIFSLGVSAQGFNSVKFDKVSVSVHSKTLELEYAQSFEQRAQGLMNREVMCEQCGMLFNFRQVKQANMWMKNTLIPLDVAFIRKDGVITDIKAMKARDLTNVSSSEEVLYAWEMNLGWFKENGISVGDTVQVKP
jgi:uncharacterized membrane protein (UPF0127 family)